MMIETTTLEAPLSAEMAEQLRRLLHKAVRSGYGQIEITVNPRGVRIVDRTEYRFDWERRGTPSKGTSSPE